MGGVSNENYGGISDRVRMFADMVERTDPHCNELERVPFLGQMAKSIEMYG